jgi:hypothetical protein
LVIPTGLAVEADTHDQRHGRPSIQA